MEITAEVREISPDDPTAWIEAENAERHFPGRSLRSWIADFGGGKVTLTYTGAFNRNVPASAYPEVMPTVEIDFGAWRDRDPDTTYISIIWHTTFSEEEARDWNLKDGY